MQEQLLSSKSDMQSDTVTKVLSMITQNSVVFLFGLLPLFFIPLTFIPLDYGKIVFVLFGLGFAGVFWSLLLLRTGKFHIAAPFALVSFLLVGLSGVVSSLLSGDMRDSLLGDDFGVYTALFSLLLALIALSLPLFEQTKTSIMRLYIVFAISSVCIALFHIVRLVFGVDVLSFGIFDSATTSVVGTWNDVALFFGLTILLSLIALEQLPLTRSGQIFFAGVVLLSLCMLAAVNFFAVWVVLALVSLSLLMYDLTKNRFADKTLPLGISQKKESVPSLITAIGVFVVSIVFIIGGSAVGGALSKMTGITYLEVRPSFEATVDIGRAVYAQDALVGIGPNKFIDAWRLYKDGAINESVFWVTDFSGGNGFITTAFVTTGIFGAVAWILFLVLFLYAGIRMLVKNVYADRFWYFIGSSAFASALYIWIMAFLYVPGSLMLMLGALFTGIFFCAYTALVPTRGIEISVFENRKATFMLVGFAMFVIVGTTTGMYYLSQHVTSLYTFGRAITDLNKGAPLASTEEGIARAYAQYPNELYALQVGAYQLAKINAFAQLESLTPEQQQELQSSIANAISAGRIVTESDPTDAQGWSLLASVYSLLAGAGVEGAAERASEALTQAHTVDPKNPSYLLREAQLRTLAKDTSGARQKIVDAVTLKRNYTEALAFSAQLDIAEGKTEDAINTTAAIVNFEPNNPARYYQLGVLLSAANRLDEAIDAFSGAVALDPDYANARYFLAIAKIEKGDTEGALADLAVVRTLNPENEEIAALIKQIESGAPLRTSTSSPAAGVAEPTTVTNTDGTITTSQAPTTPLVSPVNTPPATEGSSQE